MYLSTNLCLGKFLLPYVSEHQNFKTESIYKLSSIVSIVTDNLFIFKQKQFLKTEFFKNNKMRHPCYIPTLQNFFLKTLTNLKLTCC